MPKDIQWQMARLTQQVVQLHQQGQYEQAIKIATQARDLARKRLGKGHPLLAQSMANLASLYHTIGNYAAAEPLYRQALEILRTALGERHPGFAQSLNSLAMLYLAMGNYAEAEPLLRQALEIYRTVLGERHPSFAQTLYSLGNLHLMSGEYTAAEPLLRQALEIYRTVLGDRHPGFAQSLNSLGEVHRMMGNYAEAESLYRQALEIYRTVIGEEHPEFARSLSNLAGLYGDMGNYAKAESLLQQALEVRRTALGEGHPDVARSLDDLASLYHKMGNYAAAERLLRQALEIQHTALGERHPGFAHSLNNLGGLYHDMGNYAAAEPLLQQALKITRTALGEEHSGVAASLNNLGWLYRDMGNYAAAEPLLRQASDIFRTVLGKGHPLFAGSLSNLAVLYGDIGNYTEAETLLRQSSDILRAAVGEGHPGFAASLNRLAVLHSDMGNYAEAESLLRQALEITRTALGESHPGFALSLSNLGWIYYAMGNYAAAEPLLRKALKIERTALGEEHSEVAASLNNLAALCVATAREVEAMALMKEGAAIDDRMIGQVFSIGSESQRMAYLTTVQKDLNLFLSLVVQYLSHSPSAVQAAFELVLRRKAIGAEALAAQRDAVLGGQYPTLQPKLREWTTLRMQIGQKTLAGPGPEGLEAHQQLLAEWNAQKERMEAELVRQIPEMNLEQKLRAADRQAVAKALPEEVVLVEFVRLRVFDFKAVPARGEARWQPARYLAFVLPAGKPDTVQMIDLGEAEPLDEMIAAFRTTLTGGDRHLVTAEPLPTMRMSDGSALRVTIFDPLVTALGGCTRLFLAPEGDLTRLPFEALPTDDDRCLIDDYHISYLGVGRDVLRFGTASTGQPTEPLVVADPDFNLGSSSVPAAEEAKGPRGRQSRDLDRSTLHFGRLPGTRVEGERVAAMLDVQPLLGGAALEARLKACQSPRILHIATHGFFLAGQERDPNEGWRHLEAVGWQAGSEMGRLSGQRLENPLLRSGLALAGANTWLQGGSLPEEAEDAILNGEDVSGLDLLTTELVVLSACETGLGEVLVGEGVFGLRRAFLLAGAKTLVMSLWKVPDKQTQELMEDLYRRILEGQPRADALREAQLAMKAKYPNPLFWGAFICQGDPGPLPRHGLEMK